MLKRFSTRVGLLLLTILIILPLVYHSELLATSRNPDEKMIFEALYLESLDIDSSRNPCRDLSQVTIGDAIPSYKVYAGDAIITEAKYVPIFTSNNLSCIAIIAYSEGKICSIEITNKYVKDINNFNGEKIALVFDNSGTYVLCKNDLKLIQSSQNEVKVDIKKEKAVKIK